MENGVALISQQKSQMQVLDAVSAQQNDLCLFPICVNINQIIQNKSSKKLWGRIHFEHTMSSLRR